MKVLIIGTNHAGIAAANTLLENLRKIMINSFLLPVLFQFHLLLQVMI